MNFKIKWVFFAFLREINTIFNCWTVMLLTNKEIEGLSWQSDLFLLIIYEWAFQVLNTLKIKLNDQSCKFYIIWTTIIQWIYFPCLIISNKNFYISNKFRQKKLKFKLEICFDKKRNRNFLLHLAKAYPSVFKQIDDVRDDAKIKKKNKGNNPGIKWNLRLGTAINAVIFSLRSHSEWSLV